MIEKELQRLHSDPNFITHYHNAIDALKKSGLIDVMLLLGQPLMLYDGKDPQALAAQAARSIGWNAAISTLINFEDYLDEAMKPKANPRIKYGGLDLAVERGDILPEEKYAIERGTPVSPSAYKPRTISKSNPTNG